MKFFSTLVILLCFVSLQVQAQRPTADQIKTLNDSLTVQPIQHGTLVMSRNGTDIYVDPVGSASAFDGLDKPDIILITHTHGDHLSIETLDALDTENAQLIVPQTVADALPNKFSNQITVLGNGEQTHLLGINIRAVAMYNLPPSKKKYHAKGDGIGYLISDNSDKIYISGDTEGTPEMRALKNIDIAFVCMNLPYTMDVQQAADAVIDFAPAIVYPYHYRGQDIKQFKQLVNAKNKQIDVRLRNWYE
ncbi:L-ascorbate metabolism protein UlaG, beta-lactamase superfamily [Fodinibius salinus]|uniref:L-ascorbate metabolism protein UlaG, beta-lactamase superfamily n=1 Tax=Fodinibius salinus TaxID=860790 RepID=A0A5D3YGF5_9BACT|nr:MBL fold metallo-hydrolase [Fodinibius salinus]TYP92632.1 L-ascorbate metabolism protein UlaG, beta-lactamase superfamily [Fodinibius salinus]